MGLTGCPICYEPINVTKEIQKIPYTDENELVHIDAEITIWNCTNCKRQWDDSKAELTRLEAIDNYLDSKQR